MQMGILAVRMELFEWQKLPLIYLWFEGFTPYQVKIGIVLGMMLFLQNITPFSYNLLYLTYFYGVSF